MSGKRILFGVLTPHGGGHTRTAVAVADVLRGRGHHIDFLVAAPADPVRTTLITGARFRIVTIHDPYARLRPSFRRSLRDVLYGGSYVVLHWFELTALRRAALVAARAQRGFLWTHTSGGAPPGYYGLNRVVVYTPELARDVERRSPKTTAHVAPARIDLRSLDRRFVDDARRAVRSALGVRDGELLIVRVARCTSVYLPSVRIGLALARRLNRAGQPAVFLHAGYSEDALTTRHISAFVSQANREADRPFAHSLTEGLEDGVRYLAAADVCIGSGRSAIEALALARPTFVIWESRYLGLVDEQNIQAIGDTNFQGRNSDIAWSDEEVVDRMSDAIRDRLAEPDQGAARQAACARFIREHYSVEAVAGVYERLYADTAVTVDGFFRHVTNPRQLGRELFYRLPPEIRFSRPANFLRGSRLWPGAPQG
jgi:hypothetical protein